MDKRRNKQSTSATDAFMGYVAIVLGIACFLVTMSIVMAFVRLVVGAGTGAGA